MPPWSGLSVQLIAQPDGKEVFLFCMGPDAYKSCEMTPPSVSILLIFKLSICSLVLGSKATAWYRHQSHILQATLVKLMDWVSPI